MRKPQQRGIKPAATIYLCKMDHATHARVRAISDQTGITMTRVVKAAVEAFAPRAAKIAEALK
jgi:hypothetical protein